MFKLCFLLISLATVNTDLNFADRALNAQEPGRTEIDAPKPEATTRTVQLSLSGDADLLIENGEGKRVGLDFKSGKFVNEIPAARVVSRESSATFILPSDKSGQPYKVTISAKSTTKVDADLSLTGPGFVVGLRSIALTPGQLQKVTIAANGLHLSFTANQDGPTPQLFLAVQSGRGKPSYRIEVSSSLKTGKTITVQLDPGKERLLFKTGEATKDSFTLKLRRTNPGGTRELYVHNDISFSSSNSYAVDFGAWDGKSEMCFFEVCDSCQDRPCTKLKNESR
jgi:hypothetical protein